jgi:hypothetical protein
VKKIDFLVIPCACTLTGHKVIFKIEEWDFGRGEKEVDFMFEVVVDERVGFWRRLKNVLSYLLRREKIYIFEACLPDNNLPVLQDFIQGYLQSKK